MPSDSAIDFISGTCAGVGMVFSGHPFDTLKVKMQTSHMSLGEAFKKTAAEGPLAFYKGVSSPLIGLSMMNAVLFGSYNAAIRAQAKQMGLPPVPEAMPIQNIFLAGFFAGGVAAFVEGPVDLFKSKMQVGTGQYKNTLDCAVQITKNYGIRGIYQGHSATFIRNTIANAFYLSAYEWTKRALTPVGEKPTTISILTAGCMGGVAYWGLCYPTDIIKSKLQTDASDPAKRRYKGVNDCLRTTLQDGGVKSLYRGFVPCMIRAVVCNAVGFWCMEQARTALGG